MKKSIISLSVAASLGMIAGSAFAAAGDPSVKVNGIGMINVIPYFSTQGSNVTQISITNTDTANGKAVKVRFRGAEWSDDIFDFTVFLSPNDVFTGQVTNVGNVSKFSTTDASCTLPTDLSDAANRTFPTDRLFNPTTGTLEGYIEIINMADINPAGTVAVTTGTLTAGGYSLFTATKHVAGVAPCKTAGSKAQVATTGLVEDSVVDFSAKNGTSATTGQNDDWLVVPTTGLTSWARIIDTTAVKAYGVPATAIDIDTTALADGWYFRQANEEITQAMLATAFNGGTKGDHTTADRIFFQAGTTAAPASSSATGATQITKMYQFDMPDLSTNYANVAGALGAVAARDRLTAVLAKAAVGTEYSTLAAVSGATDLVLTQPTRRYHYQYIPCTPGAAVATTTASCSALAAAATPTLGTDYSRTVASATKYYAITGDAATPYDKLTMTNTIPLMDLAAAYVPAGYTGPAIFFNREEQYNASSSDIVISPTPPSAGYTLSLKGEASVVSFNRGASATATGALGAKLTMNDVTVQGGYEAGWAVYSTSTKASAAVNPALPIIGFSAQNVAGGNNYGTTLPLRYFGAANTAGYLKQ